MSASDIGMLLVMIEQEITSRRELERRKDEI